LRTARPKLPEGLSDRSDDIWEPLIAIADSFAGAWSTWVRTSAVALSAKGTVKDTSTTIRLLNDIRFVFGQDERVHTAVLLQRLNQMEEALWSRYHHGDKPLSANGLAKLLSDFGISSRELKISGENRNGYRRADFVEVWERFLEISSVTDSTASTTLASQGFSLDLQTLPRKPGRVRETGEKVCQIREVESVDSESSDGLPATVETSPEKGADALFEPMNAPGLRQPVTRPASHNEPDPTLFDGPSAARRFLTRKSADDISAGMPKGVLSLVNARDIVVIRPQRSKQSASASPSG
jgi:hypothetical protein